MFPAFPTVWLFDPKDRALTDHVQHVQASMARVMARAATPPSQVDPVELCDFINGEKDLLKECDADVKDAKRRINAVKPKRRKGQQVETQAAEHSESEGSASVWSWFPNCLVWIYLGLNETTLNSQIATPKSLGPNDITHSF